MSMICKCDKCGTIDQSNFIDFGLQAFKTMRANGENVDFCDNCYKEFLSWMTNKAILIKDPAHNKPQIGYSFGGDSK